MAAHPQLNYSSVEPYQRVIPPSKSLRSKPRQFSFTLGQLVISWSICAGLMAATFFFGLYAGKERGMQLALEEQARLALRVPLPERPLADVGPLGKALEMSKEAPTAATPPTVMPKSSLAALSAEKASAPIEAKSGNAESKSKTIAQHVKASKSTEAEAPKQKPIRALESTSAPKKVAAKPKQPAAPKVVISSKVTSGYYVQVSAKRSPDSAKQMAQKLAGADYGVAVEQAKVSGKQFYRVLVGPYKTAQAAKSRQKRLIKAGLSPKSAFVKRVS